MAVAHLTLDFRLWHQRGHRVYHYQVHRAGPDQDLDDLQCLFTGVGLGDQQVLDVDPQLPGVLDVKRVLGVDIGCDAAGALDIGHQVKAEGGLA